jgi:hypothetical protein
MIRIGNNLTPILLIVCAGLGAMLWQQTQAPAPPSSKADNRPAASQTARPPAPNAFQPPPLQTFREISQRTLFLSERRPPPPPEVVRAPPPAPVMPLRLVLEGVLLSSREELAVLLDIAANEVINLTIGMQHQGWELVAIEKNRVRFRRGSQEQELTLEE